MRTIAYLLIWQLFFSFFSYAEALKTLDLQPNLVIESAQELTSESNAMLLKSSNEVQASSRFLQRTVLPAVYKGAVVGVAIITAPHSDTVTNGLITGWLVKLGFEQLSKYKLIVADESPSIASIFVNRIPMTAISSFSTCSAVGASRAVASCFYNAYTRNIISYDFASKFTDWLVDRYPFLTKIKGTEIINQLTLTAASIGIKVITQGQQFTGGQIATEMVNALLNAVPFVFSDTISEIITAGLPVVYYVIYWYVY